MEDTEIYTWENCQYCLRAKEILERNGIKYTEHKIDGDDDARSQMAQKAKGRRTVPQIFFKGRYIGQCCDLAEMEEDGKLKDTFEMA